MNYAPSYSAKSEDGHSRRLRFFVVGFKMLCLTP